MNVPQAAPELPAASAEAAAADRRFLPHVHRLRAVAILLVVGAHCWPDLAWTPFEQRLILLLFDNVTVVFMFISGLLFQHLSGRFRYRRYLRHRFSIVILPYLIVSIPAVLAAVFVRHREDVWPWVYDLPAWQQIGVFLLTGKHLAPLWFMPMMALFIIASPLFILIDRWRLYPLLLPATLLIGTWLGRDSVPGLANVFGKALFMLPPYLAGMAFSRYREAAEGWCGRHIGLLAAGLAAATWAIWSRWLAPADITLIQKLLLALLLIVLLKRARPGRRTEAIANQLAALSFAIYFVHGYVITAFRLAAQHMIGASGETPPFQPSLIGLVLHIIGAAAVSVLIIRLVQRLLGRHSRMVIGG